MTGLKLTQEELDLAHKILQAYLSATTKGRVVHAKDGHPFLHMRKSPHNMSYLNGFLDGAALFAERVEEPSGVERHEVNGVPLYDLWAILRAILATEPFCLDCKYCKPIKNESLRVRCSHPNPDATATPDCGFPNKFNPLRVGKCESVQYKSDDEVFKSFFPSARKFGPSTDDRPSAQERYRIAREMYGSTSRRRNSLKGGSVRD